MNSLTLKEAAVSLLTISRTMLSAHVCARHAASNVFDATRIRIMMENGIDGKRAEALVRVEPTLLLERREFVADAASALNSPIQGFGADMLNAAGATGLACDGSLVYGQDAVEADSSCATTEPTGDCEYYVLRDGARIGFVNGFTDARAQVNATAKFGPGTTVEFRKFLNAAATAEEESASVGAENARERERLSGILTKFIELIQAALAERRSGTDTEARKRVGIYFMERRHDLRGIVPIEVTSAFSGDLAYALDVAGAWLEQVRTQNLASTTGAEATVSGDCEYYVLRDGKHLGFVNGDWYDSAQVNADKKFGEGTTVAFRKFVG